MSAASAPSRRRSPSGPGGVWYKDFATDHEEPEVTTPVLTARRPFYVVPHTHWDREWYRPFEAYRYRLVETLDGLLAADLPYFLLDGQTVVLEDYLAIRPEQADPIAR